MHFDTQLFELFETVIIINEKDTIYKWNWFIFGTFISNIYKKVLYEWNSNHSV